MLLSQQARLVRLDDHRAVVQVATTWMAMVQTRQALVEQAISRALGGSRQLTLEASGEPPPASSQPPPPLPPQHSRAPSPLPPTPAPLPRAPSGDTPPAPAKAPPAAPQSKPQPNPQPSSPADEQPLPMPSQRPVPSHLDEKTRQLAEFFNGEVVEIDGALDEIEGADAA